jgi:hypothetical protein
MTDSMKRWVECLEPGEKVCWEGRPAPRCYTFRHWKHSIFGAVFLLITVIWQYLGIKMSSSYEIWWLAWLPLPFLLVGVYFTVGHLIQARLEWNSVYYAVTDRRLLVQRGRIRDIALADITYFKMQSKGEELGTFLVHKGEEMKLLLHCIEHPQKLFKLLEDAMGDKAKPHSSNAPE